ncbi:MAG: hypothetical protein NT129_02725 [Candidatus Aenigmarchaeota archaeon]|nr:hypothetical protein [Candidatus Aenigmarchaeota archaeon]
MTTVTKDIASQEELSKFWDAANSFGFSALVPSFYGNQAYKFVPSGNYNTKIIERTLFLEGDTKTAYERANEVRNNLRKTKYPKINPLAVIFDKEDEEAILEASRLDPIHSTRYCLTKFPESKVTTGYAVDLDERGIKSYQQWLALNKKLLKTLKIQKFEYFGSRRNINNPEAIELSDLLSKIAYDNIADDD